MDDFDYSNIWAVNEQPLVADLFLDPTSLKLPQAFSSDSTTPLYNSIEDWSGLDGMSGDSDAHQSPISPTFSDFNFSSPGEDWGPWDDTEDSPPSDSYFKFEPLDRSDLPTMPAISPVPYEMATQLNSVVFRHEGVNDTRPLFLTSPSTQDMSAQTPPQLEAQAETVTEQKRRAPARTSLKRKASTSSSASSTTSTSSPHSTICSPTPPHPRRHAPSTTNPKEDKPTKPIITGHKKSHNMIEKRYRTNLNDKIAALRDSVPALRVVVAHHQGQHVVNDDSAVKHMTGEGDDDEHAPVHKLNKATILCQATEYIVELERRNRVLVGENAALRKRVDGFEVLVMNASWQH